MTAIADNTAADKDHPDATVGIAGEIFANDPCAYEQISAPWEIMVTPKDRRAFAHRKTYLITPSVILYSESFDSCVRVQGLTPAGVIGFSVPIRLGARSRYWNSPLREASLPASLPGALDAVLDAGQLHVIALVSLAFFRESLPGDLVSAIERAIVRRWLPAPPHAVDRLGSWLLDVLEAAHRRPDTFRHPASVCAFEEELLDRLMRALRLPPADSRRPEVSRRHRGLARAIEFLRSNDPPLLTVPQLCNAANVSQRTLEYAFREAFGLTPIGYLRLQRLHHARRALSAARHGESTVADIAHQAGYFELGRFAGTYRRLFGEFPSETLGHTLPPARGFPLAALRSSIS